MHLSAPTLPGLLRVLRPLPLMVLLAWALRPSGSATARGQDTTSDLVTALASVGLTAEAGAVEWVDGEKRRFGFLSSSRRALVRARRTGEPDDIYLARARMSPEGRVVELLAVDNLTRTSAVSERQLVASGPHAAWTIGDAERTYRLELADLRGLAPAAYSGWSRLARLQQALTDWQTTGQTNGIARRSFKLDPAATNVALDVSDEAVAATADGNTIRIPFDPSAAIAGQRHVRNESSPPAPPGNLITWAVDRARGFSWFGDERMQWLKAVAYAVLDRVDRVVGRVRKDDSAAQIAEEMGAMVLDRPAQYPDPETGWPPAAMRPVFPDPLPREGQWFALKDDPYVRTNPGAPPAFVTSFIRTDEDRKFSRIFVTLWDPRQVDLFMMPGTEEPQTATGATGTGTIPRDPEVLSRLVAAFNGGFQSTHGDYGMMVERSVLVPPRPYAATIARMDDGAVGFGTWPHDPKIDERLVSFRQNLTPLVLDGEINPYGRMWWGGVPQDWEDETRTVRSGLCLTREGFIAYFYGSKVDYQHLAIAMQSARCNYGLHLDMNQGHTGLEFYRVDEEAHLPPLEQRLDPQWQAEGNVRDMPGWRFRGRRMIKFMQLMHFPRYVRRSQRDFFYLTLRPVLPGAALASEAQVPGKDGAWRVEGLPQFGWPYAIATTSLRPSATRPETRVRLAKIDPRQLEPGVPGAARIVVGLATVRASDGEARLLLGGAKPRITNGQAEANELPLAAGHRQPAAPAAAAIGLCKDGMLLYAEVSTAPDAARDGALLSELLGNAGCAPTLFLTAPGRLAIGATHDLSGHPVALGEAPILLARVQTPSVRRIFEETPVLKRADWVGLQRQRRMFAPKQDTTGTR